CTVTLNLLFRSHLTDQPVNTDATWISGIKASDITQGALLGLRRCFGTAALQEDGERFVRRLVPHLLQNVVNLLEQIAKGEAVTFYAPAASGNLGDRHAALPKRVPNLGMPSVDKLSAQFDDKLLRT